MRWTGRVPQPRVRVTPRASKCVDDTPGVDDALIQPYSGHASRQSLEIYTDSRSATPKPATTKPSADSPSEDHSQFAAGDTLRRSGPTTEQDSGPEDGVVWGVPISLTRVRRSVCT